MLKSKLLISLSSLLFIWMSTTAEATVTAFVSPESGTVGSTITVAGTCTANGVGTNTVVWIDFGSYSTVATTTSSEEGTFTATFTVPLEPYGTHTITVRTEGCGSTTIAFFVADETPPAVNITSPTVSSPAYKTGTGSVTVAFTYIEPNLSTATVSIVGVGTTSPFLANGQGTATLFFSALTQGTYTIKVEIVDLAGNVGSHTEQALVIDTTPPVINDIDVTSTINQHFYGPGSLTTGTGGTVYFNSVPGEGAGQILTITAAITEAYMGTFSGADAFGDGVQTDTNSPWQVQYSVEANAGSYTVLFTVTDKVGNIATASITFIQDNKKPTMSGAWSEGSDYLYVDGNGKLWFSSLMTGTIYAALSGTATDTGGSGLNKAVFSSEGCLASSPPDDISPGNWSGNYGISASSFANDSPVTVILYDNVGNTASLTYEYAEDNVSPSSFNIALVSDSNSGSGIDPDTGYDDDSTIDAQIDDIPEDTGSGLPANCYAYRLDAEGYGSWTSNTTVQYTNQVDNSHTMSVKIRDNVGNETAPDSCSVTIDTSAPTGGDIDIIKLSGGEYLYINPDNDITSGILYYNNGHSSSFKATWDEGTMNWDNSGFWKIRFGAAFGESLSDDTSSPFEKTYSISPGETNANFKVYFINRAGNYQEVSITNINDTTPPTVDITDVTNPDYDPGGNELDTIDNWYDQERLTGGWSATSTTGDTGSGLRNGTLTLDHSVGTVYDQIINCGTDGSCVVTGLTDDPDGTIAVTVTITDNVGNIATDSLTIRFDNTKPVFGSGAWNENSPYLYVDANGKLWFSDLMPATVDATLSGTATDGNGSGLKKAVFSSQPHLASSPTDDTTPENWSGNYGISSGSNDADSPVSVVLYDNVGNTSSITYEYDEDNTPPTCSIDVYSDEMTSDRTVYDWGGNDVYVTISNRSDGGGSGLKEWWVDDDPTCSEVNRGSDWNDFLFNAHDKMNINGTVTTYVRLYDNVGNYSNYTTDIYCDVADPACSISGVDDSDNEIYKDNSLTNIFYNSNPVTPSTFTIYVDASDTGSGLDWCNFSSRFNDGGTDTTEGTSPNTYSYQYSVEQGATDSGSITTTVYDRSGRSKTASIAVHQDNIGPFVRITNITDPHYDPDGVEIDTAGNWYDQENLAGGWSIISSTDDTGSGLRNGTLTFDHSVGTICDQIIDCGTDGSHVVTGLTDDPDGTIAVTVTITDNVGNSSSDSLAIRFDNTKPIVDITSVTVPHYDPDGIGTDTNGNWYDQEKLTDGWSITSMTGDEGSGLKNGILSFDHSAGTTYDQVIDCGTDGSYVVTGLTDDPDGTIAVTVTMTDNVGNTATDSLLIRFDNTGPTIAGGWLDVNNSPYLYVDDTGNLRFSDLMGTQLQTVELRGTATDTGSGLDKAIFSQEPSLVAYSGQPDPSENITLTDGWLTSYSIKHVSSATSSPAIVTLYDHVGNYATAGYSYYEDLQFKGTITINTPDGTWSATLTPVIDVDFEEELALDSGEYSVNGTSSWKAIPGFSNISGTSFTSNFTIDSLNQGTNTIYFRATDDAGNMYL